MSSKVESIEQLFWYAHSILGHINKPEQSTPFKIRSHISVSKINKTKSTFAKIKVKPSLFPDRVTMNCKHLQTKFTDISNSKLFNFFLDEVLELPGLYCLKNILLGDNFSVFMNILYTFSLSGRFTKGPSFPKRPTQQDEQLPPSDLAYRVLFKDHWVQTCL